jgi:hypothetical protein
MKTVLCTGLHCLSCGDGAAWPSLGVSYTPNQNQDPQNTSESTKKSGQLQNMSKVCILHLYFLKVQLSATDLTISYC